MVPAKVEYAALAIVELAARDAEGQPVPLRDLSESQDIPSQFLVQLLQNLKVAGLVRSTRGAAGGYLLAKSPEQITLWDVWTAVIVEGSSKDETGTDIRRAALNGVWREVLNGRREILESVTIHALLLRCQDSNDPMYYI